MTRKSDKGADGITYAQFEKQAFKRRGEIPNVEKVQNAFKVSWSHIYHPPASRVHRYLIKAQREKYRSTFSPMLSLALARDSIAKK